jgi:hypothetical protein
VAAKRLLNPVTNAPGLLAAAGAVFAATVMIWNATQHHGIIDPAVIVAAVGAVGALLTRTVVTPVSDPKDGNGNPLTPAPVVDVAALNKPPPPTVPNL